MTFFTSPAAVLGEPSHKGHILAAEEINAQGGLLGKRKIETITADEAAGTDANVNGARHPWETLAFRFPRPWPVRTGSSDPGVLSDQLLKRLRTWLNSFSVCRAYSTHSSNCAT